MLFVVSGEGKTDFGSCSHSHSYCDESCFFHGAMHVVLNKTAAAFANIESSTTVLVHKKQLEKANRPPRKPGSIRLPGYKTAGPYFSANAFALAMVAQKIAVERCERVVAVLFRDCDFTRSENPEEKWNRLHASVQKGFAEARCSTGVPMIPLPKSETWLYCAHPASVHRVDARCETRAGNDNSVQSWKSRLEELLGEHATQLSLTEYAQKYFDPQNLKLSKYLQFASDLNRALVVAKIPER